MCVSGWHIRADMLSEPASLQPFKKHIDLSKVILASRASCVIYYRNQKSAKEHDQ
jgi:hypothetical protein